jgi:uncharacterized protein (TIGR02186 family)
LRRSPAITALALLAAWAVFAMPRPGFAQELIADLSDHLIGITSDFTGTDILVFGAIEGGGDIVVTVTGPLNEVVVRKKDRVFGIWINAESAEFHSVPGFFGIATTRPLDEIGTVEMRKLYGIGFSGLRLEPESTLTEDQRLEFEAALIELRQANGLFPSEPAKVDVVGGRLFRAEIPFPADIPVGTYQAETLLIRNGEVVAAQTSPLVINKVGFGADIYDFAHEESELYGILAVIAAVLAGLLGNLMFRRP